MKGNFNPTAHTEPVAQSVPLLDLSRQYVLIRDEINAALSRVCDSGQFVLGPEVTKLEQGVAAYCQAECAVGCASGSDALILPLMAHGVGPGDEVIVPSFTFFATVRGDPGLRRYRSAHVQYRPGTGAPSRHTANQGDYSRSPVRANGRHGSARRCARGLGRRWLSRANPG